MHKIALLVGLFTLLGCSEPAIQTVTFTPDAVVGTAGETEVHPVRASIFYESDQAGKSVLELVTVPDFVDVVAGPELESSEPGPLGPQRHDQHSFTLQCVAEGEGAIEISTRLERGEKSVASSYPVTCDGVARVFSVFFAPAELSAPVSDEPHGVEATVIYSSGALGASVLSFVSVPEFITVVDGPRLQGTGPGPFGSQQLDTQVFSLRCDAVGTGAIQTSTRLERGVNTLDSPYNVTCTSPIGEGEGEGESGACVDVAIAIDGGFSGTLDAGASQLEPPCADGPTGGEVVVAVPTPGTPDQSYTVVIFATGTGFDAIVDARLECGPNGAILGCANENGVGSFERIEFVVPGGTLFFVTVDTVDPTASGEVQIETQFTLVECGNGALEPGEECEDGNVAGGDGCDVGCVIEAVLEVEPNDSAATATPIIDAPAAFRGFGAPGDVDFFTFTVDTPGDFFVQTTGIPREGECLAFPSVQVTGNGVDVSDDTGALSGIDGCGALFLPALAIGTYTIAVTPTVDAPYILDVHPIICGDGLATFSERCDDGNQDTFDGCTPACETEAIESCSQAEDLLLDDQDFGDTFNSADDVRASCSPAVAQSGADAIFNLQIPDGPNGFAIVTVEMSAGSTDASLSIREGVCESPDAELACTDTGFVRETTTFIAQNGVDYFAVVDTFEPINSTFAIEAHAEFPECGNAVVEFLEECDDGNVTPGDVCDAGCLVEGTEELEPNDEIANATDLGALSTRLVGYGSHSANDPGDLFSATLPANSTVLIGVSGREGAASCGSFSLPTITLSDAAGNDVPLQTFSGLHGCGDFAVDVATSFQAFVRYDLPPGETGDYIITLSLPTCGNDLLEPSEECEDANASPGDGCDASCLAEGVLEVEPNGAATPNTITLGERVRGVLSGGVADEDVYTFSLAATTDVSAATFGLAGPGTCDGDTLLTIERTDGTLPISNDNDAVTPNGPCSLVSGALVAGDWRVRVGGRGGADTPYLLDVAVAACRDGVVSAGEECDDGNAVDGDGCSADCTIESIVGCANAITVQSGVTADTDLIGAADEGRNSCTLGVDGPERIFRFVAPGAATDTVNVFAFVEGESLLTMSTRDTCIDPRTEVACADFGDGAASITATLNGGEEIFFVVEASEGTFTGAPFFLSFTATLM